MCPGVECVDVQLQQGLVIVDTILSAVRIQELIEETGRKAVLFGVIDIFISPVKADKLTNKKQTGEHHKNTHTHTHTQA